MEEASSMCPSHGPLRHEATYCLGASLYLIRNLRTSFCQNGWWTAVGRWINEWQKLNLEQDVKVLGWFFRLGKGCRGKKWGGYMSPVVLSASAKLLFLTCGCLYTPASSKQPVTSPGEPGLSCSWEAPQVVSLHSSEQSSVQPINGAKPAQNRRVLLLCEKLCRSFHYLIFNCLHIDFKYE